jgi:hypothetical protein
MSLRDQLKRMPLSTIQRDVVVKIGQRSFRRRTRNGFEPNAIFGKIHELPGQYLLTLEEATLAAASAS